MSSLLLVPCFSPLSTLSYSEYGAYYREKGRRMLVANPLLSLVGKPCYCVELATEFVFSGVVADPVPEEEVADLTPVEKLGLFVTGI